MGLDWRRLRGLVKWQKPGILIPWTPLCLEGWEVEVKKDTNQANTSFGISSVSAYQVHRHHAGDYNGHWEKGMQRCPLPQQEETLLSCLLWLCTFLGFLLLIPLLLWNLCYFSGQPLDSGVLRGLFSLTQQFLPNDLQYWAICWWLSFICPTNIYIEIETNGRKEKETQWKAGSLKWPTKEVNSFWAWLWRKRARIKT